MGLPLTRFVKSLRVRRVHHRPIFGAAIETPKRFSHIDVTSTECRSRVRQLTEFGQLEIRKPFALRDSGGNTSALNEISFVQAVDATEVNWGTKLPILLETSSAPLSIPTPPTLLDRRFDSGRQC